MKPEQLWRRYNFLPLEKVRLPPMRIIPQMPLPQAEYDTLYAIWKGQAHKPDDSTLAKLERDGFILDEGDGGFRVTESGRKALKESGATADDPGKGS